MQIKFSKIPDLLETRSGIYEIYLYDGTPLKVGIAKNLRSRLRMHLGSKQNRLKIKDVNAPTTPSNLHSKQSILAKHRYFDSAIFTSCDLTTEAGRVAFLETYCYLIFKYTESCDAGRKIDIEYEKSGKYRNVGRVVQH